MTFDAKAFLKDLTTRPGVYVMKDHKGKALYVGKAKNLKNRVSNYFRTQEHVRLEAMVSHIADIEVTITNSEKEALLLENSLIKSLKPKYNIDLRDDKSYPYIFLSKHAQYPRLVYYRGPHKEKGEYFGPYPSAIATRQTLNLLQKLFKVRSCEDTFFKHRTRPCLQYQIKRCTGPCCDLISPEDYQKDVEHVRLFLQGKQSKVIEDLIEKMQTASKSMDFELAAEIRDEISALKLVYEQQAIYGQSGDADVVAIAQHHGAFGIHVLFIRDGKLIDSKSYFPKAADIIDEAEVLRGFVLQFYLNFHGERAFPREIITNKGIEDQDLIRETLSQQAKREITLSHQVKTHRSKWLKLAYENALASLKRSISSKGHYAKRLQSLEDTINLPNIERMECYDISHTQGNQTIASKVVFGDTGPLKKEYRKYNISVNTGDDYAAMEEVLTRRFSKLKTQGGDYPNLVFIDGGRGQLNVAKRVLAECQIIDVLLIGVAKGEGRKPGLETLFVCRVEDDEEKKVTLPPTHPALHLIQHIRDEAHRFAITGHRKKRGKQMHQSPLEAIPGVGEKRRQALLSYFGGQQRLMSASIEAIAQVPGISQKLAESIYQHLHDGG